MRTTTPDPKPEQQSTDTPQEQVAVPVGTFAAGQSPLGEYEVATEAPLGSFASGPASDDAGPAPD